MQRPNIKIKDNEEARIQESIRRFLLIRDWVTMRTHGNRYQKGFPDLYALHHTYGARWVEVKLPRGSVLTKAQVSVFPFIGAGHGVWVMKAATEAEYAKLHRKQNWGGMLISPDIGIRGTDATALLHNLPGKTPEALLQNEIMRVMREQDWICVPTTGNLYQHGFPDFYAYHPEHGGKWVEVKRRESYRFTPAQRKYFPLISGAGHDIWVLTSVDEINRLHSRGNWPSFLYRS